MEDLKLMQKYKRLFLANYFSDLKRDVDLTFVFKTEEKDKYLEIIKKIEEFEQASYTNNLFSNKTIMFIKNYGTYKKTFLLIINDEYLKKSAFENDEKQSLELINKEKLINFILKSKLNDLNNTIITDVFSFDIHNITLIKCNREQIHQIDPNTFNSLINLKEINFSNNQISQIHSCLFKDLKNLENINFASNEIKHLDSTLFNGLINLRQIHLGWNQIKELHLNLFSGLTSLNEINFSGNRISELNERIFAGLTNLHVIYFGGNQIKELNENLFNGLTCLKRIYFWNNKINKIPEFKNLEKIDF
jgi:Leucine-rich repeat (LRR) protein